MKKPTRFLSLLMAVMMLVGSAVPAYAFEGLGEISNVTDYGEDVPSITEEDEEDPPAPEEGEAPDEKSPSSSEPQPDASEPPVVDTGEPPEESEGEVLPGEPDDPLPTEPTVGASGLDPPDSFFFEAVRSGSAAPFGMRKARANPGSTTIYMEKISGLSHLYPFSGGTTYSAYKMYPADGRAAFCVEPARFNTTNGTVVTGSLSYSALSSAQQKEIAKAIAASGGYSNGDKYFAAQAIIWEICYGQTHRSGSVYNAVIAANSSRLGSYYEQILADMESMGEIPSFMSPDPNNPTIHEMTDNGGSWGIDLENTNSRVTLNASDFTSRAPLDFSVSGDTLTVESASEPDQDAYVEWHSGSGESGLIFWNSSQQTKASFDETQGIPADGYMAFTNNFIPNPPDTPETPPEEPGLGYLTIVKYDGETNLPLGGAIFRVECDGYINDAVDVPYGGKTIVIPIPEGQTQVDVTVTEVTAPSGYVMDSAPKTVTVTANETVNIVEVGFVNYPEACSLEIYKYETGNKGVALEGASFRIRYADPNVSAQTWTETTDGSGKIHIDLPAAGALIVEELSAPAGYVMNTKTSYDVTVAKGEQKVIDIPNDKKTQLVAIKKDAQSGQLLAGASIRATLLRSNTPPYEGGQSYTETTGPDGRAVFTNLIPGEYRVEEIAPPQFYLGTTTVHTVNILDGNTETVTVEFRNEPWTGLTIRKVDKTNAKGLPGAIFKLYKGSEEDSKAYLGDWESGENGSVTIQKLEPGYYTIVESQAPYGYLLDQEHHVQTIEIKPEAVNRNITVVFQNLPKPKLLIEKIDKVTGLRLPGAVFHVSRRGSEEYMEVRTGSDGTVLLENLEDDWYTVTEVRAPSGYVLDSQHYDVEMIPGKTVPLIINNLQQPDLLIRKVDEQTGSGVPGAVLRLTKDGAKEYKDVTTGADGTYLVKDLEPGWYIVEEIKAPDVSFPVRETKALSLVGMLAHEAGHINYTDFRALSTYQRALSQGRFYPKRMKNLTPAEEKAVEELQRFAEDGDKAALSVVVYVAHTLCNLLEDAYIEEQMCRNFPGRLRTGILLNRQRMGEQSVSITEMQDRQMNELLILMNLMIQYGFQGNINNVDGYHGPLLDVLNSCVPYIDDSKLAEDPRIRFDAVNQSTVLGSLVGKTVVVTGTVPNYTRSEVEFMIRKAGGKMGSSVTRSTDYLVVAEKPGATKLNRAADLGIPQITVSDLMAMLD